MCEKIANKVIKKILTKLKIVLVLAQCFGILPVIGVRQPNPNKLKFKWNSFRVLFSVVVIFFGITESIFVLKSVLKNGAVTPKNIGIISKHFNVPFSYEKLFVFSWNSIFWLLFLCCYIIPTPGSKMV